jgi:hypothetical protein
VNNSNPLAVLKPVNNTIANQRNSRNMSQAKITENGAKYKIPNI